MFIICYALVLTED